MSAQQINTAGVPKFRILAWVAGLVMMQAVLNACYYDQVLPVQPAGDVGEMSFSGDIIPIFNASCNGTSCHSQGGEAPDLTAANAYTSLTNGGYINKSNPESSTLYRWMNGEESSPMPLSGPNATYNAKVLAWIEQGALNN
jgi:hypothetical protein